MTVPYLEISFRHGRPFAAYVHCTAPGPVAVSRPLGHGLVVDLDAHGAPIGVEVTDPQHSTATSIVQALSEYGIRMSLADLAPLAA